ncbi:hypothetical protein B0H19DRAFT_1242924 [Mycena capillaripes]|nr:hypothetical protein B0H19DRAFT_1242924 [Mycena capillaripes]
MYRGTQIFRLTLVEEQEGKARGHNGEGDEDRKKEMSTWQEQRLVLLLMGGVSEVPMIAGRQWTSFFLSFFKLASTRCRCRSPWSYLLLERMGHASGFQEPGPDGTCILNGRGCLRQLDLPKRHFVQGSHTAMYEIVAGTKTYLDISGGYPDVIALPSSHPPLVELQITS